MSQNVTSFKEGLYNLENELQKEAYKLTHDLCSRYSIPLSLVQTRTKRGTWGTAFIKSGKIVYSRSLFSESRFMVLKTVCHEVAHLLAARRYKKNCKHNRLFQLCETEIAALHDYRPVYARTRGYAAAYQKISTGETLESKSGYKLENGCVRVDKEKNRESRLLRKVMREALHAKAFAGKQLFKSMTCESMDGRLALKVNDSKTVLYHSGFKDDNLKISLENIKYTGRSLRYNIR